MTRLGWLLGYWLPLCLLAWVPRLSAVGVAVEGVDWVRALPPPGAQVTDYRNVGYQLRRVGDEVYVHVETTALDTHARFESPPRDPENPIQRLATGVVSRARTEYEAASRILAWVANHVRYELDRTQDQDAASVLRRKSGYCTGVARLSVALLTSIGLEAREVAGYVIASESGRSSGFHRWIEIRYSDRGWVFSDPLSTHHYVPATYIRLAADDLAVDQGVDGLLLERKESLQVVDLYRPESDVMARRNHASQLAASLQIRVSDTIAGVAVLEDRSNRWTQELSGGRTTFVGLEPGTYTVRLVMPDRELVEHKVRLPDRLRSVFVVPEPRMKTSNLKQSSR